MRILHLLHFTKVAGAEKYIVDLLPRLKQFDIECDLICVCPTKQIFFEVNEFLQLLQDQQIKATAIYWNKVNIFKLARQINNYLKSNKIPVVHAHLVYADLIAVFVKMFFNRKLFIISSKHGYDERFLVKYSGKEWNKKADYNVYYFITKFLLSKIDVNLAVSKAIANLYYNIGLAKKPWHHIHHGTSFKHMDAPAGTYREAAKQLIIVGRLEKMKGHKYLLQAMPAVIEKFPETKLLVIGEGTEINDLTAQVKGLGIDVNVSFKGFQKDPYKFIRDSDVVILPSLFEPFGLVYIESFALKKPVVAFDVEATNEIIENNKTGLLVEKYNSSALAEKINFLLMEPSEVTRLAENGYEKYKTYFNVDRMVEETAAWYWSVLGNRILKPK